MPVRFLSKWMIIGVAVLSVSSLGRADSELIGRLLEPEQDIRQEAVKQFLSSPEDVKQAVGRDLINELKGVPIPDQIFIVKLIGRLGPVGRPFIADIAPYVSHEHFNLKREAIQALGYFSGPVDQTEPIFLPLIENDQLDWSLRIAAIDAMGKLPNLTKRGEKTLIRLIKTGIKEARWHAIVALGDTRSSSKKSIRVMVGELESREGVVANAAKKSLIKLGPVVIPALSKAIKKYKGPARENVVDVLTAIGTPAAQKILNRSN